MRSTLTILILLGPAMMATACSQDPETTNNAVMPAMNEQDMSTMATDPNNPFGQAEMQMNQRMMAASGANAAETWVRKMIEHHRGGIEMSEMLPDQGVDGKVLEMARKTADDQRKDIAKLETMLQDGISGPGPANPFMDSERKMHQAMMAAKGADLPETWTRKMIEHHRGGVEMSELLIAQGGDPQVLEMARSTISKQRKEIEELESMLGGGSSAASVPGSPNGAAAPATSGKAKVSATTAPPTKSAGADKAVADSHAEHDSNSM
jgi:uncharacterized protein (DUF305 family)